VIRRAAGCVAAALLLAGCGTAQHGRATLWVTRDRGSKVLLVRKVAAGQTAMQALRREADVSTRYGGRFVQSIEGLEGSLSARRDWFYFVNGIGADRSASEYRLHPGDVEWWDYRSWSKQPDVPIVVGAFPEPFRHGWDGKVRPAVVRYAFDGMAPAARRIGRLIRASSVARAGAAVPKSANVFLLAGGEPGFEASLSGGAGGRVTFRYAGDPWRLIRHPEAFRYRYSAP
jgi:hypothetical protein